MVLSRRNVLVGLGATIAGGGALLGTGAFTTVSAARTVSVETADDSGAFLALEPASGPNGAYADGSGDTVEISLDGNGNSNGLNQNAVTAIRNIIQVTNNGDQEVTSLELEFTDSPSGVNPDDTFTFLVDESGDQDSVDHASGGVNILTGNDVTDSLSTGDSVNFGVEVDLIDGGNSDNALPNNGDYTLTITADSG